MQINRREAPLGGWEEFTVEERGNNIICLKSCHGNYLSAQQNGTVQWNRDHAPRGGWEEFNVEHPGGTGQRESATLTQQHLNTGRSSTSASDESIQVLEAVSGKPVRFKLNNPPIGDSAWVGIYPLGAEDKDHGEEGEQWNWLSKIDMNNAIFSEKSEGRWSIRVFSDGGFTLDSQLDFEVLPKKERWWVD